MTAWGFYRSVDQLSACGDLDRKPGKHAPQATCPRCGAPIMRPRAKHCIPCIGEVLMEKNRERLRARYHARMQAQHERQRVIITDDAMTGEEPCPPPRAVDKTGRTQ